MVRQAMPELAGQKNVILMFDNWYAKNGWGMFVAFLQYKLEEMGKSLVKIDRFFASSQACSVCGYKNSETKNLSVRAWDCPEYGTHHDRDINAAVNIRNEDTVIILLEGIVPAFLDLAVQMDSASKSYLLIVPKVCQGITVFFQEKP